MRILHLIADLAPAHGGPTKLAPELCRALARRGHEVSLFTTDFDVRGTLNVPTHRPLADDGYILRFFPVARPRRWKFSPALGRAMAEQIPRCDVVHLHNLYLFHTWLGGRLCRRYGVPYIISPHGALDPFIRRRGRLKKAIYHLLSEGRNLDGAAAIHYTAQAEMDLAHEAVGIKAPGAVAPLGVELEEYEALPPPGRFRERYPEIGDKAIILFLSRLNFKKGLDLLARAYGKIARQRSDVHLVIAGPDYEGYGRQVRRWLADEGVLERTTFTGMILGSQKLAALRDAALFALPSYSENFGIVVVEAMAAGLPVVISDQVNIYREVEAAGAGLVAPCDPEPLAARMLEILDDSHRAARIGEQGRALCREKFHWDAVAAQMEDLYRRAVGK